MKLKIDSKFNIIDQDQDYILFLGTSHTMCECKRGLGTHLKEEDTWVYKLSEKYKLPYVRLAFGGSENWQMLQMLISFIRDNADFHRRCKMVIADVRLGGQNTFMSFDSSLLDYNDYVLYDKAVHGWHSTGEFNNNHIESHINASAIGISKETVGMQKDPTSKRELQTLFEASVILKGTAYDWQRCFYDIVSINHILDQCKTPFFWFTFSDRSVYRNTDIEVFYNHVLDSLKSEYSDVWSKNIAKEDIDIMNLFKIRNYKESGTTCECLHLDENFQNRIADYISDKISKLGEQHE